jgi:hypothetical protein
LTQWRRGSRFVWRFTNGALSNVEGIVIEVDHDVVKVVAIGLRFHSQAPATTSSAHAGALRVPRILAALLLILVLFGTASAWVRPFQAPLAPGQPRF